jgi:hypothetical protein
MDGTQITSALAMRHFDWRENNDIFRGAMIGAVFTHPARRGEGLASRLLAMATVQLREEGVDFGILWTGQPSFYARLGWMAADSGVLGEIELNESMPEPHDKVTLLSTGTSAAQIEVIRRNWLNTMTFRNIGDYNQLPLSAERVDVLWCEMDGKIAYALLGGSGTTGFLYELVGDATCFLALWREICHGRQRVFVNDQIDNSSCRWLTDHTGVIWKKKNLAMWLPLSERVSMPRLGQWYIPYFDRI